MCVCVCVCVCVRVCARAPLNVTICAPVCVCVDFVCACVREVTNHSGCVCVCVCVCVLDISKFLRSCSTVPHCNNTQRPSASLSLSEPTKHTEEYTAESALNPGASAPFLRKWLIKMMEVEIHSVGMGLAME